MRAFFATAAAAVLAAASGARADPKPPTLTFLYSINLTMAASLDIGSTPTGSRGILPITGGTFSGPKLNGNVSAGLDWGLTDSKGTFSPDAVYVLQTTDGARIMVSEHGRAPNVNLLFDTGHANYTWLNTAVGYASGGPAEGGIALDVWQISSPA
ncbi:Outer membrane protein, beta-barrel [Niveomyces insectorum RCEF 264]|uniref:Outer membrane protein, beta-barrel n=1 Tax=Niveomyces insectorum RCEF 264 TaxID=1081102 RepID=A0A167X0C9_9HYPO|nr:Outer membrane protein, beta-barrel [Niveomyces insectorum RCEF 264]